MRRQGWEREQFPHVKRWFDAIEKRPAVQRGMALLNEFRGNRTITDQGRDILFGKTQFERR